jgi:hypothetical protein
MNPFRDEIPDELNQSPARWLWDHYDEYWDWMTETQTYEQYYREHAAVPENPVMPKNWYQVVDAI